MFRNLTPEQRKIALEKVEAQTAQQMCKHNDTHQAAMTQLGKDTDKLKHSTKVVVEYTKQLTGAHTDYQGE